MHPSFIFSGLILLCTTAQAFPLSSGFKNFFHRSANPIPPFTLQKPIIAHGNSGDGNSGAGTIHMLSTAGHSVDVQFSLASTPTRSQLLAAHSVCIIRDLSSLLNNRYPYDIQFRRDKNGRKTTVVEETVIMEMRGVEYRSTLAVRIEGDRLEREMEILGGLVTLLMRSAEALVVEVGREAFGSLREKGIFEDVEFEATWTFFEVENGIVPRED